MIIKRVIGYRKAGEFQRGTAVPCGGERRRGAEGSAEIRGKNWRDGDWIENCRHRRETVRLGDDFYVLYIMQMWKRHIYTAKLGSIFFLSYLYRSRTNSNIFNFDLILQTDFDSRLDLEFGLSRVAFQVRVKSRVIIKIGS